MACLPVDIKSIGAQVGAHISLLTSITNDELMITCKQTLQAIGGRKNKISKNIHRSQSKLPLKHNSPTQLR